MPPFLSGVAGLGLSAGGAAIGVAGNLVGAAVSGAIHVATSAISGIGSLAVSVVGTVVRTVASLPGLVLNTVTGLFSAINNGGGAIIGALLKVGTVLGGLASGALAGFAKYLQISVRSMMDFAKAAAQLRVTSGLSLGTSGNLLGRLGGFGIGADAVNGALGGQPAALWRMRAGMFGLPGLEDPSFAARYASTTQRMMSQGMMGQMQRAAMDRILGTNNPQFQALSMMSPGQIAGQQAYTDRVYSGIGAEGLRKYAVDIPLVFGKITSALDALKQKAAIAALPVLDSLANGIANLAASNMDGIVGAIQTGVQWLFVKAPLLAMNAVQWVAELAQGVVGRITEISGNLAQNLPQILGGVVQWLADTLRAFSTRFAEWGINAALAMGTGLQAISNTVSRWLDSLADGIDAMGREGNPFGDMLSGVARALDYFSVAFKGLATLFMHTGGVISTLGEVFYNAFQILMILPKVTMNSLAALVNRIPDWVTKVPGVGPHLQVAKAVANSYQPVDWRPQFVPFTNGRDIQNMVDQIPTTDFYGALSDMRNDGTFTGASAGLRDMSQRMGSSTFAQDLQDAALRGVGAVYRGGMGAANFLAPPGQPNIGTRAGEWAQPYAQDFSNFMSETVKPGVDAAATAIQQYTKSLGTEAQRTARFQDELLRLTKEQTDTLRHMAQTGNSPETADRVVSYFLNRARKDTVRGIRTGAA